MGWQTGGTQSRIVAAALLAGAALAAGAGSPAAAGCVWVPCQPSGWPDRASQPSGWPDRASQPSGWPDPASQPSGWPDPASQPSGWPASGTVPQPGAAAGPARDAYEDGYAAGRADARAAAHGRPPTARRTTTRERARPVTHPARQRTAVHPARRPARPETRAPRHRSPPAGPSTAPWQSSVRDHAASYGAAPAGGSIDLSAFTGRGERWESTRGYRVVWSGPVQPVWREGQLCGWGGRAEWSGTRVIRQSPAWVCQCPQGWRPPGAGPGS